MTADIASDFSKEHFHKPLKIISDYFYDKNNGIFTIQKSHFPIPCLNGNMLYLHNYFGLKDPERTNSVIDFFDKYQRFDDGDFNTPSKYPYFSNKSCYGKHSCYWGIIKLLKGLSFIPKKNRSAKAKSLLSNCIEYVLIHNVCYSSKDPEKFLHKLIQELTFPNMYKTDFLEVLWLLKREEIHSEKMSKAINLFRRKMNKAGLWEIERQIGKMIIPLGKKNGNNLVTERAKEVYKYYN